MNSNNAAFRDWLPLLLRAGGCSEEGAVYLDAQGGVVNRLVMGIAKATINIMRFLTYLLCPPARPSS